MSRFVPLRSFIFDRLYFPGEGYFCKNQLQIGELSRPLNFRKMIGYDDYILELSKAYPSNAWLTPCQIFKPFYGMSVARYFVEAMKQQKKKHPNSTDNKLRIVQAGAGMGSAAESIIYYFQNFDQNFLQHLEYTIVEISPMLCQRIEKRLKGICPKLLKNGQIKIVNEDISNYKSSGKLFMCFFEVLDNLPHDKVLFDHTNGKYEQYVIVDITKGVESSEKIENDPLIQECLDLYLKRGNLSPQLPILDRFAELILSRMLRDKPKAKDLFLPTFFLKVMKNMAKNVPQASFLINDFSNLPSKVAGIGAPIVSRKGCGSAQKKDYDTYLVKRGEADIFFPVNFDLVSKIHAKYFRRGSTIQPMHQFFKQFGDQGWACTQSGYNPIKEDFANTSFFVSDIV